MTTGTPAGGTINVLILGGYGVFGGRLAQLLADLPGSTIFIAGRSLSKAQDFCARYSGQTAVRPLELDRRDVAKALETLAPDLVVDASGPFQDYGTDRYSVVQACIDAGIDYLDFADAADFVRGISQFDRRAKEADTFVLSGVSSFPVLTAAVLRKMSEHMEIVSVEGGIAPSPFAGVGLNVMRAVIGYAGAPVKLLRDGKPAHGRGLAEIIRYTIAPPGRLPLRNIRFSLVDVPDLQVIPPEYPSLRDIWMGAGPVPEFLHRILNSLARARARFGLPSLAPFARLFHAVLNLMKFGEHRGGMFVRGSGIGSGGESVGCSWHLLAEADDGPFIPSMAVEGIVRKLLAGDRPMSGARPAISALELADYERLFKGRSIFTGFRRSDASGGIYQQILASAFDSLPEQIKALHSTMADRAWSGRAEVRRGRGLLSRAIARLFSFPDESEDVPVAVRFAREAGGECWTRTFGNKVFSSHQSCGTGRDQYLLVERFGVVAVSLALVVEGQRLFLIPRRWSLLGLSMPKFLLPRGMSFESEQNGRFQFDVTIRLPFVGLLTAYRGYLQPECTDGRASAR